MPASPCRLLACLLIASISVAVADEPTPDPLARIAWLQGKWSGIGEGEQGTSAADRHAECLFDCRYLRIEGRSVYPKQDKNPNGEIHRQTDMWSFDRKRGRLMLRTFDSLGFATTYAEDTEASSETRIVMVAEHLENVPDGWNARYTYTLAKPDEYRELFELDSGKGFKPYVSNRFLRSGQDGAD